MNDILPRYLYTAEQVRSMDDYAIHKLGISGFSLMQNAGKAALALIRQNWPDVDHITVFCGSGNNGGDGYIVAGLALECGIRVQLYTLSPAQRLKGDAALACQSFEAAGGVIDHFEEDSQADGKLIVDGLLGTGLDRDVSGLYAVAIRSINQARRLTLALDIPSGLHADQGIPLGVAVQADRTVTFIGLKQGLFTGYGPQYCGKVSYSSLAVPESVINSQQPSAELIEFLSSMLKSRPRGAHKGDFGHLLVIGGDTGYIGAIRLAAEAAARVGAGLVSVATRASHAVFVNITRPEIMCRGTESPRELMALLDRASVVAIGPGLGQSSWAREMLKTVLETALPLVLDADALSLLAENPCHSDSFILTPHPGEAARLLNISTNQVQNDRFAAASAIQKKYGGVCVLKGSGTIVQEEGKIPAICQKGNPGMASGGMGDVLTGVIGGLLAQQLSLSDAARFGTDIHSAAADEAARYGQRGLLAADLMQYLRGQVNLLG